MCALSLSLSLSLRYWTSWAFQFRIVEALHAAKQAERCSHCFVHRHTERQVVHNFVCRKISNLLHLVCAFGSTTRCHLSHTLCGLFAEKWMSLQRDETLFGQNWFGWGILVHRLLCIYYLCLNVLCLSVLCAMNETGNKGWPVDVIVTTKEPDIESVTEALK